MTVLSSKDNLKVRHWRKLAEDPRYRRAQRRASLRTAFAAGGPGAWPHAFACPGHGKGRGRHGDPEDAAAGRDPAGAPYGSCASLHRRRRDATGGGGRDRAARGAGYGGSAVGVPRGVQDPANVGAILRTAAAFGVRRVVLDQACADPGRRRRCGRECGGHFALVVGETKDLSSELDRFAGTVVCTVVRDGTPLAQGAIERLARLGVRREGRGLTDAVLSKARLKVTVPVAPGTESLNVAAAVAVCLYEASRQFAP